MQIVTAGIAILGSALVALGQGRQPQSADEYSPTTVSNGGTIVGSVVSFATQFYAYTAISAYIVGVARYMIAEHGGWPWVIWPMAFFATFIATASGFRDAMSEEAANPELKRHPKNVPIGWSVCLANGMFIVFAIFPGAVRPLWDWLPGLGAMSGLWILAGCGTMLIFVLLCVEFGAAVFRRQVNSLLENVETEPIDDEEAESKPDQ